MRQRKTVDVDFVKRTGNHFLANSEDERWEARAAVGAFLSGILHESGNYKGFRYLDSAGVENPGTKEVTIADDTRTEYL